MKAIQVPQFGPPEVMRLAEVADPIPGAGQVVVKVHAAGVNPVETYFRSGIYGPKPFPYTPGTDAGGVIHAIGSGVTRLKVGDRVYTAGSISGTYAELALCDAAKVYRLPDAVSYEQGAAIGIPYATAYRAAFHRGQARAAETVLVHGASGGVGTASVQLMRAAGLTVIGTASSEKGRQLVLEQGAHHVVDHSDPNYFKQITDLTGGRGVDLILELLANVNLGKDLTILAKGGRVVVIGSRGPVEIVPRETMGRDADIRGMTLFNASDEDSAGIHAALAAQMEFGIVRPIVGQRIPLAEAPRAHVAVMEKGAFGKIVLIP